MKIGPLGERKGDAVGSISRKKQKEKEATGRAGNVLLPWELTVRNEFLKPAKHSRLMV